MLTLSIIKALPYNRNLLYILENYNSKFLTNQPIFDNIVSLLSRTTRRSYGPNLLSEARKGADVRRRVRQMITAY